MFANVRAAFGWPCWPLALHLAHRIQLHPLIQRDARAVVAKASVPVQTRHLDITITARLWSENMGFSRERRILADQHLIALLDQRGLAPLLRRAIATAAARRLALSNGIS